jgi:hypothetical protein
MREAKGNQFWCADSDPAHLDSDGGTLLFYFAFQLLLWSNVRHLLPTQKMATHMSADAEDGDAHVPHARSQTLPTYVYQESGDLCDSLYSLCPKTKTGLRRKCLRNVCVQQ